MDFAEIRWRVLWPLGCSALRVLLAAILLSVMANAQESVTDFRTAGPNLLGAQPQWSALRGQISPDEAGAMQLAAPAKGAIFTTPVSVGAEKEFFFAVSVRSPDRLVVFLGGLSMSYHAQGEWQRVCGLVRSRGNHALELKLDLRPLGGRDAARAEIKDLVLRQVDRPESVIPLNRSGETPLVSGGAPMATIVYPEADGRGLAEKIQSAIREKTGVPLPIISDREATEKDWPMLKPSLQDKNLILIGNLEVNRAFWPAYNRFRAAADGYYPGGDGFVVRTAVNVFANGRNQILLAGSSAKGIGRAVDKFLEKILSSPDGHSLPWLLDVELGGKCLEAFEADNALWKDPEDSALPAQTPGYGKVARWYRNALGYYWSGWPQYLEREKQDLRTLLSERAYTHQYLAEFLARTASLIEGSPALTQEQSTDLDGLILQNFLDFLTTDDLSWMTTFSPPYSGISMRNRHQLAPWLADLTMARFLRDHVQLGGMLKELVSFRLSEKEAVFHAFASSRNGPSLPGIAAGSDYEEFPAALFRYALENDLYPEFFGGGLAHQALALDRVHVPGARYAHPSCDVDLGMWLGAMALLTGDARYQWLNANIPFPPNAFQGRYVAGVHRYQPTAGFPVSDPSAWAGIQVAPQPHKEDQTPANDADHFPHITLRGGFHPTDDLLMVAGVTPDHPAGALIRLDVGGVNFLGGGGSRATTNGASVVRLDAPLIHAPATPSAATLLWKKKLPGVWAFAVRTPLSGDMDWERTILRLKSGQFVFRDVFRAQRSGRFQLRVNWRSPLNFQSSGDGWQLVTRNGNLHVKKLRGDFVAREDASGLAWESVRDFRAGEVAEVWTLASSTPLEEGSLDKALAELPASGAAQEAAVAEAAPTVEDQSGLWSIRWAYDGLLRPARIKPKALSGDLVDFGAAIPLAEIRTLAAGRFWQAGALPTEIFAAPPEATAPPADDAWLRVEGDRVARPGPKTGNYGEATPMPNADEALFPKNLRTRFLKAKDAASLQYFRSDALSARHPVRLQLLTDLPGGKPVLLADNGRFPAFPRAWRDDDFSLALLNPGNGRPLAQVDVAGPVQGVLVADQRGGGAAEIFVLRMDARVDAFGLDGSAHESMDLHAIGAEFQKRYGRENTRHPAGGHAMPFSVGLWRPNKQGARKWVIGRYGSLLFLDEDRKLEGILNFPSYAGAALLPHGMDFDGDGREEILLLERANLVHVAGDAVPSVRDPGGSQFWPQIYDRSVAFPKEVPSTPLLAGAPVLAFHVLQKFSGKPQFVFVARENFVGLYNAIAREWTWAWSPPAPIVAAALLRETSQRMEFCLSTTDGLFWTVTLDGRRPGRPMVAVSPLPLTIHQMQSDPLQPGLVVLAAKEGLFLRSQEGQFLKIAEGAFSSAVVSSKGQIIAADQRGQVQCFQTQP